MEDFQALREAQDFKNDVKTFGYNTEFIELQTSRACRNYERILKRLKEIELPDPNKFKYSNLSRIELKEYLKSLLTKVLGSDYLQQIEEYNCLLRLAPIENPFDAILESEIQGTSQILKKIRISNQLSSIQIISTSHEYIHAMLIKYMTYHFNDVIYNYHYKELLSIIVEYIVCYELSILLKKEQLQEKHNIIRLFNNKQHALEHQACENLSTNLRKMKKEFELYKDYFEFESHSSYGYILSDVYATKLLDIYKEDSKILINIIRSILKGEKNMLELITYFGLSLNDEHTISLYNKRLDNIPKL